MFLDLKVQVVQKLQIVFWEWLCWSCTRSISWIFFRITDCGKYCQANEVEKSHHVIHDFILLFEINKSSHFRVLRLDYTMRGSFLDQNKRKLATFSRDPSVWLPGKSWISSQESWIPEFPGRNPGFLKFLVRHLDSWISW